MERRFRTVVYYANDDARKTTENALASSPNCEVKAYTTSVPQLLALCAAPINLLIMEAVSEQQETLLLVRQIHRTYPNLKILMFSKEFDTNHVDMLLQQGISGYLLANAFDHNFSNKIAVLESGNVILSHEIAHALMLRR